MTQPNENPSVRAGVFKRKSAYETIQPTYRNFTREIINGQVELFLTAHW